MIHSLRLAALLVVLASAAPVHALATESLGNAPIGRGFGFDDRLLDVVNVSARVYWFEVNGNPFFFFKGSPKELNEALRRFAALGHDQKEIILLPGPGMTHTLGRKPVAIDWSVHVPMGLKFGGDSEVADTRATFTIHIPVPLPPPLADPAQARRWIANLGSDDFKTRSQAAARLEALGPSVATTLREALTGKLSAEARDRLERVLEQVSREIRLDVLALPEGIPVVGLDKLLDRSRRERTNKDHQARGVAASALSHTSADPEEVLPDLEKVLQEEKHEYPLRCAIGSASRLGAAGKPLLPIIRGLLSRTDDQNVRNSCEYAINAIEKAKPDATPEAARKARALLRQQIREFVGARKAK
jgi:hypothetical protein